MPNFWKIPARRGAAQTAGSAALDISEELHPIQLYTSEGMVTASVAPNGERMLDILNQRPLLRLNEATLVPYYSVTPAWDHTEWTSVAREEVLLVAPPDHSSPPGRRIHRRQRRVELVVPPFAVVGNAHMTPGFGLNDFLRRQYDPFIPVTVAWIHHVDNPSFDRSVPVVLVNVAKVSGIRDLLA